MKSLIAINYKDGNLEILDQVLLPHKTSYIKIESVKDGWEAIAKMQVRGGPAIAIVGCLSLVVELLKQHHDSKDVLKEEIEEKLKYLISARPTAVNIKNAADEITQLANKLHNNNNISVTSFKEKIVKSIEEMLEKDVQDNNAIGFHGAEAVLKNNDGNVKILTHCNFTANALATAGYGTALGVIRSLHKMSKLEHAYCTETRPYNQGARLTAYELVYENIPATLITDSMVAALMQDSGKRGSPISAVIVGADRIAANGDTANKIGTYQIAVTAKHHGVPFYIAAPYTAVDFGTPSGDHIKIEERPESEMTHVGGVRIAAEGIKCWNPSFDVTPAALITGIITEKGVAQPHKLACLDS